MVNRGHRHHTVNRGHRHHTVNRGHRHHTIKQRHHHRHTPNRGYHYRHMAKQGPQMQDIPRRFKVSSRTSARSCPRHTSHVTRHTLHVTRHTSYVTRHTSHVTRHTSRFSSGSYLQPTSDPYPAQGISHQSRVQPHEEVSHRRACGCSLSIHCCCRGHVALI
jgi:hypothetical protein